VDDIISRTLNPGVILTMIVTGIAYGHFLWALNVQPASRLYAIAIVPGAIFVLTILVIRSIQGTPSLIYATLFIDWLIFAHSGFFAVLVERRRRARK
jgi:uncharacterized YccA/Bax inhibitor family protein